MNTRIKKVLKYGVVRAMDYVIKAMALICLITYNEYTNKKSLEIWGGKGHGLCNQSYGINLPNHLQWIHE